jgi:hypothetical protein
MRPRNNLPINAQQSGASEFVARTFTGLVMLWPATSRDWALAMQAELGEMESTQESLKWLAGGMMSLIKAWWNQVLYGWKDSEKEPSAQKTPGPLAFTLALVAVAAFFMLPSVHEGFSAVLESWRSYNNTTPANYLRMAREAEANHDAKTLAYLSSRMGTLEEDARLSNEAVAMDPSLTWIYVKGGSSWYSYYNVPQKYGWAQKLEASDPDNAATYLMEATVRSNDLRRQLNYPGPESKMDEILFQDQVWRGAMEKAFAAPRYDSYSGRMIALEQSVLKAHNMRKPQDVAIGIFRIYPFGLWDAQSYSNLLLAHAKEALRKGDTAGANHMVWTAAHFAERARNNMDIELVRRTTDKMLLRDYQFLQPLEASAGHTDVAKLLAIQTEAITRKTADMSRTRMMPYYRAVSSTGFALHSAGFGIALFGCAVILAAMFLFAARFGSGLRTGRLYRWACNCGRFAPVCLAASIALMAATYAAYLDTVKDYFSGIKDAATLQELTTMEYSLSELPGRLSNPLNQGVYHTYFWTALLVTVVIAGALFLSRNALRPRVPRVKAA